ncbi:MAG: arylsulfatase A-like enzyme [Verrucomicrobiales bacterium]|jgi:arylsulfatase A-like enzyme
MKLHRLVFTLLATASALTAAEENRYNVLFIAIDDLRPELACYGSGMAQSPHLDRFASTALQFNRHYVAVPTCGASRYALLTGRHPISSGVTRGNQSAYSGASALKLEMQAGAQSMPELFRRSGYRTVQIGKISHTGDGRVFAYNGEGDGRDELPHAWNQLATPLGAWKRGWGVFFAYAGGHHREDGNGHRDLMEFTVQNDADLPDGLMADAAIEQLQGFSKSGERFFLGLGLFKPHLPFVAPQADWDALQDAYDRGDFHLLGDAAAKSETDYWHRSGEFYNYAFPFTKEQPLAQDAAALARRGYAACVRYSDRQVGKVLETLESTGLSKNTIVVVWGDHGWHLGEQQIWGKHSPLERALRSALIVRVPGMATAGQETNALVETTDLYPTLRDLCATRFSDTAFPLDGASLRPVIDNASAEVRDIAVSHWGAAVSIRSDRHRLVYREKDGETVDVEMFDFSSGADALPLTDPDPSVEEKLRAAFLSRSSKVQPGDTN